MKNRFKISQEDLIKVYKVHHQHKSSLKRNFYLILGCIFSITGLYLLYQHFEIARFSSLTSIAAGIYFIQKWMRYPSLMAKWVYNNSGFPEKTFHISIEDQSITTACEGFDTKINVKEYKSALITDNLVLLYFNNLKFHFYLKKYFASTEKYTEFINFIKKNIRSIDEV